jgi:hypothetical protein
MGKKGVGVRISSNKLKYTVIAFSVLTVLALFVVLFNYNGPERGRI